MAPKYDVSKVSNLTDADKLRLISAYLNHNDPNNVNWDSAATDGGSKSKDSYKKMLAAAYKKLTPDTAAEGEDDVPAPEPAPAPAAKRRKRAAPANEGEEEDGTTEKKTKKPRKPRAKKTVKVENGEEEDE